MARKWSAGPAGPTVLSAAADRGRDDCLRPELVAFMLVVVVGPGLGDPAIPHMEHQNRGLRTRRPSRSASERWSPTACSSLANELLVGVCHLGLEPRPADDDLSALQPSHQTEAAYPGRHEYDQGWD